MAVFHGYLTSEQLRTKRHIVWKYWKIEVVLYTYAAERRVFLFGSGGFYRCPESLYHFV